MTERRKWRSKHSRGRAQVGLGFETTRERRVRRQAFQAALEAADAFLAHREPWDMVSRADFLADP